MDEHNLPVPRLPGEPMRRRLISSRLITLLKVVEESAQHAYEDTGFTQRQRQVVLFVGNYGELVSSELVPLMGCEKAQVSRAVKALESEGLLERDSLRSPLRLTEKGHAAFRQFMDVAHSRSRAFTVGLTEDDVRYLLWMTRKLTERAALLFTHEREVSADAAGAALAEPSLPDYRDGLDEGKPLGATIMPVLHALLSYMKRSASLAYRREHGLSHFEWMVLSQVGEHQPIAQPRLIAMVRRNKSQVGRAIACLEQQELVTRWSPPGRRENLLRTTDNGWETYRSMCGLAIGREDFLWAENSKQDRDRYIAILEKISTNAELLLAREEGLRQVRSPSG